MNHLKSYFSEFCKPVHFKKKTYWGKVDRNVHTYENKAHTYVTL